MDYQRTGDTASRDAVVLLSQYAAFSGPTPLEWTAGADTSREVAYAITGLINAEAVGAPHQPRLDALIDQALGHLDQWFVSQTAPYMRPFMVGLTMEALIQAYQVNHDSRIPPAIAAALQGLWTRAWLPVQQTFMYTDRVASDGSGGTDPAPDLNLLIAPAYAWMYRQTGDITYRQQGDQIFAGGVRSADLDEVKQFNQNYEFSFDYLARRG
jgi:hypothetical protein